MTGILTPMKSMGLIDYDMYKKTYKISDKFNKKYDEDWNVVAIRNA